MLDIEKRAKTQNIPIKTRCYVDNFLRKIRENFSIKRIKNLNGDIVKILKLKSEN